METITLKKGEIIFREGDPSDCMYDMYWGSVGIYSGYGAPQQKLLTQISGEEFFGEMGMLDHTVRSATAVALEDGTMITKITEQELGELFQKNPARVLTLMQDLSRRLRKLTDKYMAACQTAAGLVGAEEAGSGTDDELRARVGYFADAASKETQII